MTFSISSLSNPEMPGKAWQRGAATSQGIQGCDCHCQPEGDKNTHPCFFWEDTDKSFLKTSHQHYIKSAWAEFMAILTTTNNGLSRFLYPAGLDLKTLVGFVTMGFRPMDP